MYYIIYKITNKLDKKVYIGAHKTNNINDGYMGSGKILLYAQKKYGIENFEKNILYVFDNKDDMLAKEAEIVNEAFVNSKKTYNLKVGGFGGFDYVNSSGKNLYGLPNLFKGTMFSQTEEGKKKISEILKKKYQSGILVNPMTGRKHSEETRKKISDRVKEFYSKKAGVA